MAKTNIIICHKTVTGPGSDADPERAAMMFLFQSAIHVQYIYHIVLQMYKHGVHKYYIVV